MHGTLSIIRPGKLNETITGIESITVVSRDKGVTLNLHVWRPKLSSWLVGMEMVALECVIKEGEKGFMMNSSAETVSSY